MDRKKPIRTCVKEFISKYGTPLIALARLAYEVTRDLWNDGGPGSHIHMG